MTSAILVSNPNRGRVEALRFGRLTLVAMAEPRKGQPHGLCRCDCGEEKVIAMSSLRNGLTKSCGCLRRETKPGLTHGQAHTRTYNIWIGLKQRCSNPNHPAFKNYGGRGISFAPQWKDFAVFLKDMGEAPEGTSIERVNNNRGYEPGNCIWADRLTQGRNTRRCRMITHAGETKTLGEWADQYGINRQTLAQRLRLGWPIEKALNHSPAAYHNRS